MKLKVTQTQTGYLLDLVKAPTDPEIDFNLSFPFTVEGTEGHTAEQRVKDFVASIHAKYAASAIAAPDELDLSQPIPAKYQK